MSLQPKLDQANGVVNGGATPTSTGATAGIMQSPQLASELKNLVGLLNGPSGSLEQLLQQASTGRLPPIKPTIVPQPPHHNPPLPTTPSSSTGGWTGRKRGHSFDFEDNPKRRRSTSSYSARQSGEKQHNKGLRHFSQRVCEKVREKGTTTYVEVAEELVKELSGTEKRTGRGAEMPIDEKNIRRRVYDALNVLMAMNIISKEKKEIKWIGLPTNSVQECQHIEAELVETEGRIQSKRSQVEDLLVQILTFKNLMKRNRERVSTLGTPTNNSAIGLPFIIVNTNKKTTIDCSISSDKSEYVFNFDNTFELHQDIDVLKKMGLDCGLHSGNCTADDLQQAKAMLPKAFESTLDELVLTKNLPAASSLALTPPLHGASPAALNQSPSFTSTPTPQAYSPSVLSPLVQAVSAGQGSPLSGAQIAAAIAQVKQVSAAVLQSQAGSPGPSVSGLQSPGRLMSSPGTPQVSVPSPRSVTALVTNALRGGKPTSVTARPLNFNPSPIAPAKSQLHSHCPSLGSVSPLTKSTTGLQSAAPQGASSQISKSPGPKIVTVSKLPVSSANLEHLSNLLQALQQNSNLLKQLPQNLVSAAASMTNGVLMQGADASTSRGVSSSSPGQMIGMGQTEEARQTGVSSCENLTQQGLATTTMTL